MLVFGSSYWTHVWWEHLYTQIGSRFSYSTQSLYAIMYRNVKSKSSSEGRTRARTTDVKSLPVNHGVILGSSLQNHINIHHHLVLNGFWRNKQMYSPKIRWTNPFFEVSSNSYSVLKSYKMSHLLQMRAKKSTKINGRATYTHVFQSDLNVFFKIGTLHNTTLRFFKSLRQIMNPLFLFLLNVESKIRF